MSESMTDTKEIIGTVYSVEWIYEETTSKWGPRRDSRDETLAHQAE